MSAPSPKDCKDIDERLLDYLYEELEPAEMDAVAAHIAGCSRCQAEVSGFRRVRSAAQALPMQEPSDGVTARLLEAARQAAAANVTAAAAGAASMRMVSASEAAPSAPAPASSGAGPAARGGDVVDLDAARVTRRRGLTRFLKHPAFAAAAGFVVVGFGAVYFVTVHGREIAEAPMVAAEAPAASPAPSLPTEGDPAVNEPAPAEAAASDKAKAERSAEASTRRVAEIAAVRAVAEEEQQRKAQELTAADRPAPSATPSLAARRSEPEAAPPPAMKRPPSGHGVWLGNSENRVLQKSIALGGSAGSAAEGPPPSAVGDVRTALSDEAAAAKAKRSAPSDSMDDLLAEAKPSRTAQAGAGSAPAPVAAAAPAAQPAAPSAMNARANPSDLQEKLAEFRAAAEQHANCPLAVERYYEIRAEAPAATTSADRLAAARCLSRVGRFADASAELQALRDDAPELRSAVSQELQRNSQRRQQLASQQRGQAAQTPAVHAAPKKAAPARRSDEAKPSM